MDRPTCSRYHQILPVYPEEPFGNPPRHLDQYSVRLLRQASEGAQEQPWCGHFLANILERLVPRAEAGDRLSPDGSADQEPNARGIPVASQDKPSLTMIQVRQQLAIAHNLREEKKKKPVLHAEDEFELLKTLYTSTEMTSPHERYRAQLALIMQLAGITGNRPAALLAVRYRHIKVTLLPDPEGGEQPRVLMEIVFHHTKGYLGEKDA
ncbi:MAG: hypothetical protein Q9228_007755, partial [Teloschistes exilis]